MAILVADLLWYELNVWMWLLLMVLLPAGGLLDILPLRESVFWMLILVAIFVGIYQFGRRYVKRVFGEDGE